jgi:hypothetical protein
MRTMRPGKREPITWRTRARAACRLDLGHGICFEDVQRPESERVVAFMEGYAPPVTAWRIESDSITGPEVLADVERLVKGVLEHKLPWLGMISDRIEVVVNG